MEEKGNKIVCEKCNMIFTMKKNLYAHLRRKHDKHPIIAIEPKQLKQTCNVCGQKFGYKSNLSRHIKRTHKEIAIKPINHQRNSRIICPYCSDHFSNYEYFRNHLTNIHDVEIEYNEYEFESVSAFRQWKAKVQESTLSLYVLHTSPTLLLDGGEKAFYNCHRSYNYIPKGKGLRIIEGKGSNKIGRACPSRMEVLNKSKGGPVQVKFWKTHIGHSFDTGCIGLSKETRVEIAGKLKEGVTFDQILKNDEGDSQRILLQKKSASSIKLQKKDISTATAMKADDIERKAELVIDLCDSACLNNEAHKYITNSLDKIISIMNKRKVNPRVTRFHTRQRINPNAKIER